MIEKLKELLSTYGRITILIPFAIIALVYALLLLIFP